MIARAVVVVVVGLLLAAQVVGSAAVESSSAGGSIGANLWPSHPAVVTDQAMAEIGADAAHGQSPAPTTLRQVDELARLAPLAPEPFLIKGALAQVDGRQSRAEQLFAAARARAPRSVAARYFLADRYLRTGRVAQALSEISVLSRLFPQSRAGFGPALAQFAHTPGAVAPLRGFFRSSPEIEPMVLSTLADDARNADLILALWGRRPNTTDYQTAGWQKKLLNELIAQGSYAKAYSTWRLVAGVNGAQGTIFNPGFAELTVPPPFNWTFDTTAGVVESAPSGRLQVIYYGRNDAALAEQVLLLAPGRYQLSMEISDPPGAGGEIAWTLTCMPRGENILRLPIQRRGPLAGSFVVPQGCPAQRLQLNGLVGDFPQSQAFTVGRLGLTRLDAA
ncbi:MAG: tetratricopeptide repeat protein [Sphingomicrobium sp.]